MARTGLLLTLVGIAALKDPATGAAAFWLATPIGAVLLVLMHRAPRLRSWSHSPTASVPRT